MNGGWKRLKKSEIISITLMELLLLLSFVCLIVIKDFYEEKQGICELISSLDRVVEKGKGEASSGGNDPISRMKSLLVHFDKLPSGWTSLQPPAPEKQVLLKKIELLEEDLKTLQNERRKMLASLETADPNAARAFPLNRINGGGGAPGKRPCMVDGNKILALYSITVADEEFYVKPIPTSGQDNTVGNLPVKIGKDGAKLSAVEFRNQMALVSDEGQRRGCTYYAEVKIKESISVSASTKGVNTVNRYFYPYGPIQIVKE